MVKYISFDLDGTLSPEGVDNHIWNEAIPLLFSKKNNLSLKDAEEKVFAEYYRAGWVEKVSAWTDIEYWFKRLGLTDWNALVKSVKDHVTVYPDAIPTLEALYKQYDLIVITAAGPQMFQLKLEAEGLSTFFKHTFSASSVMKHSWKKDKFFYEYIIKKLGVQPEDIIHVGNDLRTDVIIPESVGIQAIHLDRNGTRHAHQCISSLQDLQAKIALLLTKHD